MPLALFFKSYIPAHTRRMKNGQIVQVQAYSDKRLRKDATPVHVDHDGIKAEDKEHWTRLHKEQHVLHHVDKALHERRIKEATEAIAHHQKKAAHHEAQRDSARAKGDSAALSEHNKALTHHRNKTQAWANKRAPHERQLAKVNHKLDGIQDMKEKLWAGSGEIDETGDFGPIYRNFKHDAKGAIEHLKRMKTGEAVAALHHPEVGDIDLVWGKAGTGKSDGLGLAKLVKYHPEVVDDLQGILLTLEKDDKRSTPRRVQLESKDHQASIRLDWDGKQKHWLLTAFEKKAGDSTRTDIMGLTGRDDTARSSTSSSKSIAQPTQNASGSAKKIHPTGNTNEVKTAQGTKVNTQFAVVEAADLITSHDANGNANPNYPSELQPRNRGRDTSQAQIARIAKNLDPDLLGRTRNASNGAPIIGSDGVVESGNGRTLAINQAYQTGKADDYRDWLEDIADTYGLNTKQINAMKNPVLVRVRTSDINRAQFAREANQSDMLAMTGTEKAKADANHLTHSVIGKLAADGDLSSVSNRDFIMAFMGKLGDDESAGLSTTDGKPTKQLYDRVQAAIFAKAYNDDRLLELMADEAKPEIANIIKSLNQAAPAFITARSLSEHHTQATTGKLTDAVDVSLDKQAVDAIIKATETIKKAKNSNMSIEELINQEDIFGDIDPVVAQMALFIKDNNKSASRMGEAFTAMADYLVNELKHSQNNSLFSDDTPINMIDVLNAANSQLQKRYGDKVKAIGYGSKGGFIDMFTETMGQNADREAFLAKQPIITKALNTGHPWVLFFRKSA